MLKEMSFTALLELKVTTLMEEDKIPTKESIEDSIRKQMCTREDSGNYLDLIECQLEVR